MIDHAKGAKPYTDINPAGLTPEKLPHRYLALTGNDRQFHDGHFEDDDGQCCQFTAGRARCKSARVDHVRAWPQLGRASTSG